MQKDEIKDLLQYLKNVYESEETSTWLNKLQIKDLLDYITNLQTIEREYSAILSENAELENKINNLQEENEKLLKKSYSDDVRITKVIEEIKKRSTKEVANLYINLLQGKSDE